MRGHPAAEEVGGGGGEAAGPAGLEEDHREGGARLAVGREVQLDVVGEARHLTHGDAGSGV